jgi:alkylhydroperoxidase family enzyme
MTAFINPPKKIPFLLKIGIRIAQRLTKKVMLPAKLLTWYPKAAISSAVMESMIAHKDRKLSKRILKLIRMQTSFVVSCAFCIDMNSAEYQHFNITEKEIKALQGRIPLNSVKSFSKREKIALEYAKSISNTPILFQLSLIKKIKQIFNQREIIIIATTVAQVNYWARLLQALGVPAEGFTQSCSILNLNQYKTLDKKK